MGRELKYVLVREEELKEQGVYMAGARKLLGALRGEGILVISPENGLGRAAEECLLLATSDALIEEAILRDMAVLAFENADYPMESRSKSPVLLQGFEEVDANYIRRIWQRKQGIPWTILVTRRCVVRELELADLDDLFEMYEQPGMTDYIEPLYPRKEEEEYQRAYIRNMYDFYGYGMWVVRERGTDRLIGRAGLEHREIDGTWELELGYAIARPFQRQGYAREVCAAIIEYAWERLEYERLNCLIEPENLVSIGLVEQLGFRSMGRICQDNHVYERYILYP